LIRGRGPLTGVTRCRGVLAAEDRGTRAGRQPQHATRAAVQDLLHARVVLVALAAQPGTVVEVPACGGLLVHHGDGELAGAGVPAGLIAVAEDRDLRGVQRVGAAVQPGPAGTAAMKAVRSSGSYSRRTGAPAGIWSSPMALLAECRASARGRSGPAGSPAGPE
jgi:hypothetical protein